MSITEMTPLISGSEETMRPAIVGFGTFLPETKITNADLIELKRIRSTPERMIELAGIESRYVADRERGETCAYMGAMSIEGALASSGIPREKIRAMFVSDMPGDTAIPGSALE